MLRRSSAWFLIVLLLLQSLDQGMLVVNYQLQKVRITREYCVNKERPQLHCNGRCYLARQLRRADAAEKKAPAGPLVKMKYEVVPAAAMALPRPSRWPLPARSFPARLVRPCPTGAGTGVFRPPLPAV
jgi:hypothetical protein